MTDEIRQTPRGSKSKGVNVTMPCNHLAKIRSVAFDEPEQTEFNWRKRKHDLIREAAASKKTNVSPLSQQALRNLGVRWPLFL